MRALSFEYRRRTPKKFAASRFTGRSSSRCGRCPTTGARAASVAYQEAIGAFGSCTWTTS